MPSTTQHHHPQDNEAPARPKRSGRLRSLSFCCLEVPKDMENDHIHESKQRPTISPIATLRRKAANRRKNRHSKATRGTVTLHPPRSRERLHNVTCLSRRAASTAFVEPDEALPTVSPTRKRKEMHKVETHHPQAKVQREPAVPQDPITLEDLGPHQFVFTRTNGSTQAYNVESLVDYVLSSGNFAEPVSRISFSDAELLDLDQCVIRAGLSRVSLLEAKKNVNKYMEQKHARDLSFGIDRMVGDIVAKMMDIVEQPDSENTQIELTTFLFPEFEMFFQQLMSSDPVFAQQCGKNYTTWIRGPPNKPTRDVSGLLSVVTGFIGAQAGIDTN